MLLLTGCILLYFRNCHRQSRRLQFSSFFKLAYQQSAICNEDPCHACEWPPGCLARTSNWQSALSALDYCWPIRDAMDRVSTGTTEYSSRSHFHSKERQSSELLSAAYCIWCDICYCQHTVLLTHVDVLSTAPFTRNSMSVQTHVYSTLNVSDSFLTGYNSWFSWWWYQFL